MSRAFTAGCSSRGADVIDIGLASTDQLWFASGHLGLPGAMFTASHNPGDYNGIKFCLRDAAPIEPAQLVEIARRAMAGGPRPPRGAADSPSRTCCGLRRPPARAGRPGRHPPADGGGRRRQRDGRAHPAGGARRLRISSWSDCSPILDGSFPNHPPNPLEPENLVDAQAAVTEHGADLALVFDGDADRCFMIDERGEVVNPSTITAMIASQELDREPGGTIVINAITSAAVAEIVAERGGRIVITKVGHTFVKAAMAEHGADLRRRALRPLLLPGLLGRRHRHAGRPARARRARPGVSNRCRRSRPSSPVRQLRGDQLDGHRCTGSTDGWPALRRHFARTGPSRNSSTGSRSGARTGG